MVSKFVVQITKSCIGISAPNKYYSHYCNICEFNVYSLDSSKMKNTKILILIILSTKQQHKC